MNTITPSQSPEVRETKVGDSRLSRIPFRILAVFLFLIPLFFIPFGFPFGLHKSILLVVAVVSTLLIWIFLQLKSSTLSILPPFFLGAAAALPLAYTIAAFFSPVKQVSFLGRGFEPDTVSIIALLTLLMLLVVAFFRTVERQLWAYAGILGSFGLLALFHLIRLLARGPVLSFGVFTNSVSNTVGSWNELGIFFGFTALLSFLTLELLELTRRYRIIANISFYLSLAFVAVIGGRDLWYVIGIIALIIFAYSTSFKNISRSPEETVGRAGTRKLSSLALVLVIVSFFFIIANGPVKNITSSFFRVSSIEVRSSWQGTWDIAKQIYTSKRAAVGIGPNRFPQEWTMFRPQSILGSQFWDIELGTATSFVATSMITTGLVGVLAWLLFFAVFIYYGVRALLLKNVSTLSRYFLASSFFVALYLWIFAVLYTPSLPLLALTFATTGLFIASCIRERVVGTTDINLSASPRTNFIVSLILIITLMATIAWVYAFIKEVAAETYYQKAVIEANTTGNLDMVETYLGNAITLSPHDVYYRLLVAVDEARLGQVVNQQNVSEETLRTQFQNIYQITIQNASLMLQRDPTNYQNWLTIANFHANLTSLGVEGAYESAVTAYDEVEKRNSNNPALMLLRARLELAHKDVAKAKEAINKALQLKPNYTDAIFLLSQIQVSEGNVKDAITSIEAATVINPGDYTLYFNLGLLKYNEKNFEGAAAAFERAIQLNEPYANAKYFLGLSYHQLKRNDDAIRLFEDLKVTNPDNQEVDLILNNLKAGKDPFDGAKPPIDNQPEKRDNPPVEEKTEANASSTKAVAQ